MLGKLKLLSIAWLYHLQKKTEPTIGISIIICARNELKNLENNLPVILQQDYENFEVILVDDDSEDGSFQYLQELANKHIHLKLVQIKEKKIDGKKEALKKGITQATFPFILLTDADCKPLSNQWIKSHAMFAQSKNSVVLGYGKYQKTKGFLNMFIRFDTASIATEYMSRALWRYPYMGVGRNMGYSSNLSPALNEINKELASGDDDLFVQAIQQKANFQVNLENNSFTLSTPKSNRKDWLNQKARHTTTATSYTVFTQIWLLIQWLVKLMFYLGVISILLTDELRIGLILLLMNGLSLLLFNALWMNKLGEKDLILLTPILDFIYTFVQPLFVIQSWGRKKNKWN